ADAHRVLISIEGLGAPCTRSRQPRQRQRTYLRPETFNIFPPLSLILDDRTFGRRRFLAVCPPPVKATTPCPSLVFHLRAPEHAPMSPIGRAPSAKFGPPAVRRLTWSWHGAARRCRSFAEL